MTYDELFLSPEKRLPTFRKLFNYVWWKRVIKVSETTFTELLLQTEEGQKKEASKFTSRHNVNILGLLRYQFRRR